jgi:ADP-ribosylglycohydrolase
MLQKVKIIIICLAVIVCSNSYSNQPTAVNKIRGCLLGAALGDALGAPVEFIDSIAQIKRDYFPHGIEGISSLKPQDFKQDENGNRVLAYTDDTAMTLVTIQTLLTHKNKACDSICAQMAKNFALDMMHPFGWARPARAPGRACLKNVTIIKDRVVQNKDRADGWWKAGGSKDGGCGSVMHAHPFGLVFHKDPEKAAQYAAQHSLITHGAPLAQASCAAMAIGVAYAFQSKDSEFIAQKMMETAAAYDQETADKIEKAIEYAHDKKVSSETVFKEFLGWAAHDAIAATVYVFLTFSDDLLKAILFGVNTPGDSDSIASMAGALVGARVGIKQIPQDWIDILEGTDKLKMYADLVASV